MKHWHKLSEDEISVLQTVFWSKGCSRLCLAEKLHYSKSKTNTLVSSLLAQDVLIETGLQHSSGGRRPEKLEFNSQLGVILAVDIGATSIDVALMTPNMSILKAHTESADVGHGPCAILTRVKVIMRDLLNQCEYDHQQVIAIGIGVPGPVDFEKAQLVNPPLMPEWDAFSIRDYLRDEYQSPIFVDNDVNLMALGTLWHLEAKLQNFLVIKVGTGIGCGVICHGQVYRGTTGSAGDVGHICVDQQGPRCRCGNLGCVEAMAAAPAIVSMAMEAVHNKESFFLEQCLINKGQITIQDVRQAGLSGDAAANKIIAHSGNLIGQMLAAAINFFNPAQVFIGGGVTHIGPLFLASVRQSVYQRSLALSTRHLEITDAPEADRLGLIGAGVLAIQETLSRYRVLNANVIQPFAQAKMSIPNQKPVHYRHVSN